MVGLLGDEPDELTPAGVADRTSETTIADHPSDVEVFDVDRLVVAHQRQSLLVVIIPPSPRHLIVGNGDLIPRNIVTKFEARLGDDPLFTWEPETAVSQHPYLEFTFVARQNEELTMTWVDDEGEVVTGSQTISIEGV